MCPLKEVLKSQPQGNGNLHGSSHSMHGYAGELEGQFVPFYACPKCQGEPVKYCSQRCFQQDWFKIHQFECSG